MQGGEAVGGGEGEGFVALGDDALVACDEGEVFYMPLEVVELEFEGFSDRAAVLAGLSA